MANAKKVGTLIKKARTDAGLTQEQLAKKVTGASASDIGKAERGEKELTTDQLKQVAKATGVTQKSLLDAAKGTQTVKPAGSSSSSSGSSMKLSAAEKKLIQLYRKADDDAKQKALKALGDEQEESSSGSGLLGSLLGGSGGGNGIVDNLLGLLTGKREMPEGGEGEVTELKAVDPNKK
ncbi:MAG: helix-turn-helix transcriptional regulator [Clostridia bacterium]|nr:helix-turn-helix transcriptional regulator [Clostridia bacterium]